MIRSWSILTFAVCKSQTKRTRTIYQDSAVAGMFYQSLFLGLHGARSVNNPVHYYVAWEPTMEP